MEDALAGLPRMGPLVALVLADRGDLAVSLFDLGVEGALHVFQKLDLERRAELVGALG